MQIPQIRMQSQMALIGMRTTQGQQTIHQPNAQITIQQPKADVQIDIRSPQLNIDQSQAWNDMGLYGPLEASEQQAQDGKRAWLQSMAEDSQEGDQLMKIENKGNHIASISKNNAYESMKDFNVGWIPSHFAVKTNYEPGEVSINVQRNDPIINAHPQNPVIEYQRGNLETYIKQRHDLQIDVEI